MSRRMMGLTGVLLLVLGFALFWTLWQRFTSAQIEISVLQYDETCLVPDIAIRPTWECYEVILGDETSGPVTVRHEDGETHRTHTFVDGREVKFRFTPSKAGRWTFSVGGGITVHDIRPDYAKGFVAVENQDWIRTATGEAFVPQFIMYDGPDLDRGLREFVVGHGFTGFHIRNLRDFMQNYSYFEAVILKTYRQGGITHFWVWGDAFRRQTPSTYGVDADRLYREISARLGPLPGWTVGYGFDLFEWASSDEVVSFRNAINSLTSYRHLVGARGHKNQYRQISEELDYASWEWHRPSLQDYIDHLRYADGIPAFSEDRFRVRQPTSYPEKDYDFDMTRRGLWHAAMAGGVANIWGYKPQGYFYSAPYPNKQAIRTYREVVDSYYVPGMSAREDILEGARCLRAEAHVLCYLENSASALYRPGVLEEFPIVLVVDATTEYREFRATITPETIELPSVSDWAIVLLKGNAATVGANEVDLSGGAG